MIENKLQIEINNRSYKSDNVFASVNLNGGFAVKYYLIDDKAFVGNYAFYNVLFNYLKYVVGIEQVHFDVQRACSTISFVCKKEEIFEKLEKIITEITELKYNEETFLKAKEETVEAFENQYKSGAFRAYCKALEVSDLHKHFKLREMIEDIQNIDYKVFSKCAENLLIKGNIKAYLMGDIEVSGEFAKLGVTNTSNHSVIIGGFEYDSYLRQESHVVNQGREDYNLIIEVLEFDNKNVTNFTKQVVVELLAEEIMEMDKDIWVDSHDASIIFSVEKLKDYKSDIRIKKEEEYIALKKKMLERYIVLMEKKPEFFAVKASRMMGIGIYIDQYLEFLDKCSYEMFQEILSNANYRIIEAQVLLRKELVR